MTQTYRGNEHFKMVLFKKFNLKLLSSFKSIFFKKEDLIKPSLNA
jgi:hypothetical protein